LHPVFPRASDHLLAIRVELLAIEMCVRIDEHRNSGVRLPATGLRLRGQMPDAERPTPVLFQPRSDRHIF
jgi:hypothetical protein